VSKPGVPGGVQEIKMKVVIGEQARLLMSFA